MYKDNQNLHSLKPLISDHLLEETLESTLKDTGVPPLLLTIPQVARVLNLSRAKIYQLIKIGKLPVVRIDRCIRVSWASLQEWVQLQEQHIEIPNTLYPSASSMQEGSLRQYPGRSPAKSRQIPPLSKRRPL